MQELYKYEILIRKFIEEKITIGDFEKTYLAEFKKVDVSMDDRLYFILQELFAHVDAYTDLPFEEGTNDQDDYLNEEQLRQRASDILQKLYALE